MLTNRQERKRDTKLTNKHRSQSTYYGYNNFVSWLLWVTSFLFGLILLCLVLFVIVYLFKELKPPSYDIEQNEKFILEPVSIYVYNDGVLEKNKNQRIISNNGILSIDCFESPKNFNKEDYKVFLLPDTAEWTLLPGLVDILPKLPSNNNLLRTREYISLLYLQYGITDIISEKKFQDSFICPTVNYCEMNNSKNSCKIQANGQIIKHEINDLDFNNNKTYVFSLFKNIYSLIDMVNESNKDLDIIANSPMQEVLNNNGNIGFSSNYLDSIGNPFIIKSSMNLLRNLGTTVTDTWKYSSNVALSKNLILYQGDPLENNLNFDQLIKGVILEGKIIWIQQINKAVSKLKDYYNRKIVNMLLHLL